MISNVEKKSSSSTNNKDLTAQLKKLSNTEEIKDFYEYTEICIKKINLLAVPSQKDINDLQKTVKFRDDLKNKKIAVFDLDETLIHSEPKNISKCDVIIDVKVPSGEIAKIGVNIRPGVMNSLKKIKKDYVLVIYTASHQAYADAIVDFLDPKKKLFNYRLYRDNCLKLKLGNETVYVKDLRIFKGIDLKNIVIIDNSVLSFAFHLENGIPILPFYDNKRDNEMAVLVNYLATLADKDDLRLENKKYIKIDVFNKKSIDKSSYNSEKDTSSNNDSLIHDFDLDNNLFELKSCNKVSDTLTSNETDKTFSYGSLNNSIDQNDYHRVRKFIEDTHKSYISMFEK